ncbi:hypothetical protein CAL7716_106690 (plasmid) [Calothrix sp. PCC 7716]|nr:hypothetical protein CAL7716_106690 [Calothrix sp. PCC 7716]
MGVDMAKVERESINFKLPKPLADALRKKAAELDTTATDLVIQGLNHVLGDVPGVEGSVEKRLYELEEEFWRLKQNINVGANPEHESRLIALENKLSTVTNQLAKFEGALLVLQSSINASKSRKSSYSQPLNSQPIKIEPHDEKKLAFRLSTTVATLTEKRTTLSAKEFESWTRDKDSVKRGWRFDEKDGLYHEVSAT